LPKVAIQPQYALYAVVGLPVDAWWQGHARTLTGGGRTGGYAAHGAATGGMTPVSSCTSAARAKAAAWAASLLSNASQCLPA